MNTKKKEENSETLPDLKSFNDLFRNEIRFRMWGLFNMFSELSLTDLSEIMGKNKSTLYPHLKLLESLGFVELDREETIKGKVKSKIYKIKHKYYESLRQARILEKEFFSKPLSKKSATKVIEQMVIENKMHQEILEIQRNFYEKLLNSSPLGIDEEALLILNNLLVNPESKRDFYIHQKVVDIFSYLSEESYWVFREEFNEFVNRYNERVKEEDENYPNREKPYYLFTSLVPLKEMLDYLRPKEYRKKN